MLRLTALLLTVLTGFSGLVYEVSWEKYLATLLGSHSEATAAVLGIFLGGLALGYSLFGAATRGVVERAAAAARPPRLLFLYGFLEAGIGVYALLFPMLFAGAQAVSFLIPHGSGGLGFALDVALSALLIGPPAVLMGGTIPILTQALARSLDDATRFHALVYALNTAGAFAGALAAGFWLIPRLGLVGVLVAMGVVNLAAGSAFILIGLGVDRRARGAALGPSDAAGPRHATRSIASFALVALLCGFAMMAIQTVLIRLGGLSFGASQFTFSMVVAVFVLCIALGSLAVSALPRIPAPLLVATLWALVILLGLLYLPLPDATYWAHVLRSLFITQSESFYPYYFAAFWGALIAIGPPIVLSGAILPLIFHHLRRELGDLGDVAGRIYGWNTLGSLLGALLGGYALLYWLDLHHVFRVALAALAVAAAIATLRVLDVGRWLATTALVAALIGIVLLPAWPGAQLSAGLFRFRFAGTQTYYGPAGFWESWKQSKLEYYNDDPTTSVAVKRVPEWTGEADLGILTNGKSDGTVVGDYVTMSLAALLPAVLAERAERAFVIGYGTGVTAGVFAELDSAREVLVAEISPGVIEAAPFFDEWNHEASKHPKIQILQSDAYRALVRSEGRFDVIASEPSNPWVTGVEMLFSREFLEVARDRLRPGGVHAQWLQTYETDLETVEMVLRTYVAVFDHVAVWFAMDEDLLVLGLTDPGSALDLDRIAARVQRPDFAAGLERADIRSLPQLLAHELLPLGVVHATPLPGELHTLLHPRLSHLAAHAFFIGKAAGLPVTAGLEAARIGRENSLLARYLARLGTPVPESVRTAIVEETCTYRSSECLTLLAQWAHESPDSRAFRVALARARQDRQVNPGLVRALSRLFGGADGDGATSPQAAQQATSFYSRFYHHGAPFSRERLAAIWSRCGSDPAQRESCVEARREAEETLGSLETRSGPGGS